MMNLDSKTKSKLAWVGALLAPVMAVQAVRLVFGSSASPAPAAAAAVAEPVAAGPTTLEPEKTLTPAQTRARNWLGSHSRTLHARSPMDRADPTPVEVASGHASPGTPDAPAPVPAVEGQPTGLVLTGMIAGGPEGHSLASISHRVYRVGDTVVGNWRVSAIDTRKRMVTLSGPEGREMSLTPAAPSQNR